MLNILVLEDDEALATELVESLELLGHRATWSDGQALRPMEADCDLVMLDLGLGRVDGFEILELLAGTPSPPPIAVMSGTGPRFMETARALASARGLKLVATLSKPFSFETMQTMLESIGKPDAAGETPATPVPGSPYYVFQYKNDLVTGAPVGCEVLVRLPGVTDIANWFQNLGSERSLQMTVSAAGAAIDLHKRLSPQGRPLPVAFNCPPDIFGLPQFLDMLRGMCVRAGVCPAMIPIELTEQRGALALLDLSAMACRYALAGFPIHLDDFGTGASSVEQMLKLPLNELKIDRDVFRNLSANGKPLLSEITAFCAANNILSTIEGVETETDVKIAIEIGADYGQGFFWSRPSPITDVGPMTDVGPGTDLGPSTDIGLATHVGALS
jgi:EAL domain-containing protein (putative c-di-GMP-specific phosphodiesterase class I)/ActR/RegA family two-component response regulator